ncbi:hypothetical protein J4H86_04295 [Spiractinospora alimapuensis]|uniref:glycine betaine ABC transporter substrate-binding protein n=1 Tax=Spiractinospora alimapuensis TaxID=2820884 RepID=UPI001F452F21|nr:glycine betaine ABC transporter substrate-binding protein [Spiractinospora alimapuensis]QVQ53032.1 hypothetical protein J4H86_04295 [Spiractinospora alimapuensis]
MAKTHRTLAGVAVTALALSACGGGGSDSGPGDGSLDGAPIVVGSKEFPEQTILGHIAIRALEEAGADPVDETGIEGTENVRRALETEEIDLYWEYTGTGWSALLGHEIEDAPDSAEELYAAVAEEDEENGVVWYDPGPMNNTYAVASAPGVASGLGVTTISEYAELVEDTPEDASMCAAAEFITRDDGLPGLEQDYGFDLPGGQLHEMELGVIHTRVPDSDPCNFGEVFATDGEIVTNDLEVLEDDLESFPSYNVALTTRSDIDDEYGDALRDLFAPITEALTDEVMQDLNARLIEEGELEEIIAEDFLIDHDLI